MHSILAVLGLVATISYGPTPAQAAVIDYTTVSGVKQGIEEHFGPSSPMDTIAFCESTYRQFDTDGKPLRGIANPDDVGMFMINQTYWREKALSMGWDIDTPEGNMMMADWLFNRYGFTPWSASYVCIMKNSVTK